MIFYEVTKYCKVKGCRNSRIQILEKNHNYLGRKHGYAAGVIISLKYNLSQKVEMLQNEMQRKCWFIIISLKCDSMPMLFICCRRTNYGAHIFFINFFKFHVLKPKNCK